MCFAWISEQTAILSLYSNDLSAFYNRGRECLLRGTDWVFISEGYSFVLKGLRTELRNSSCFGREGK